MANYMSATRSNYFHVKDKTKFYDLIWNCSGEDEIEIWEEDDGTVGFGCNGTISGYYDRTAEECNYDKFLKKLQKIIADDDACIIYNAGWEKLRFVGGNAIVVTKKEIHNVDLTERATEKARELLNDPNWTTTSES